MKSNLRIGVVGAGAIAQLAHLPVLSKIRGAQLVALCDNDRPKARSLAERFDVPDVYTDIEDMLDAGGLDAVVITTPNHLHEPHVLSALRSRVHVLCERPLSLTSRGVERILSAAASKGVKVAVGNNHRFRSDVQQLARFLEGGELGKVQGVRTGHYQIRSAREGWRYRRAESGGGAFMEYGFPLLDLTLWVAGFPDPVSVTAHMDRERGTSAVEDVMFVQLRCAGGMLCTFDVSWCYIGEEERWWLEVLATRGSGRLAPLRVVKLLNGRPLDVSPSGAAARESVFLQSYRAQLTHFVAMVSGDVPYEPPSDQVTVHKVVEAIYRSAETESEITLRSGEERRSRGA
jgi:predicted dehydrogenase